MPDSVDLNVQLRANELTSISTRILDDDRLSWAARGIAAWVQSIPDWLEFDSLAIVGRGRIAVGEFFEAMYSLEECGYIVATDTGWRRPV